MKFDYDATVLYPFGYGLSYTSVNQEMGPVTVDGDGKVTVDVTVTNTGSVAGKSVVELYYTPPYTNGGIEKSAVNLAAFAKSSELAPGASDTLTLSFNLDEMASYDMSGTGGYVLEAGDYVISLRSDAHTVIDQQTYTVSSAVRYDQENTHSGDVVAATNVFSADRGDFTLLSRTDGFANLAEATASPASYDMADEYKATFFNNTNYDPTVFNNPDDVMPVTGAQNGLQLVDLRGADYTDAKWEQLLDQMSVADMNELIAMGGYQTPAIASIGKVSTIDLDGPVAIQNNFNRTTTISYPAAAIIANTWNVEIARAYGESMGKMAGEMDASGWYAPAMNIHRSAFEGRNTEYFSEDPLVSGKMAVAVVEGSYSQGVYTYIKHFALNEQETNRGDMLCTWSDEQSIREIYLKPFEMSVKQGGATAVMSSFNYIGTRWAGGHGGLLNTVLRDEWGFKGMVITDWFGGGSCMDSDIAIRSGNDLMLAPFDAGTNYLTDTISATGVLAMRQASKNILYTVVNSRAYEPENLNPGLPAWQIAFIAVDVVVGLALVAWEIILIRKYKLNAKNADTTK